MVNFKSIIETQCFMFLIGEDQTPFQIHTGALTSLSPMMAAMIGSGMKESIEGTVILEDVDLETFRLFAEYAYTSMYRLSPKTTNGTTLCFCIGCGSRACDCEGSHFPYCKFMCRTVHEARDLLKKEQYCIDCGVLHFFDTSRPLQCSDCHNENTYRRNSGTTFAQYEASKKPCPPAMEAKFKDLDVPVAGLDHKAFRKNLESVLPRVRASNLVYTHAKLYVFADTYMIGGLKPLCLHLLHRDLSELEVKSANIDEIIELISYTYDHTVRKSNVQDGIGEDLRELVMAYVGWRANWLSAYDAFQDLIAKGGDFATDFTRALLEQLQT